jgi:hypothetical protein
VRAQHAPGDARPAQGLALARHASTQTTDIYLQADPTEKLEALAAMKPPMLRPGKFRAPDRLIASLRVPAVMRTSKVANP